MAKLTEAKKLLAARDALDAELADNEAVLKANNCDMKTPLVDAEGFPDAKIDVYAVRHARHKIICLQNDRKELTDKIESAVHAAHEEARHSIICEAGEATPKPSDAPVVHRTSNDPFVKIGKVTPDSPAAKDGIREGDQVIQFGTLHHGNFTKLDDLSVVVKESIDKPIRITMLRNLRPVRLILTPRIWTGKGVVGCLFEPIPK